MFYSLHRIRSFVFFITHTLGKILSFLFVMIIIIFSFAIIGNNLFGNFNENFGDIAGSITSVLLFSIGHFPYIQYSFSPNWLSLIILLMFIVIIYFFLSTFAGMSLESFRIVSMRKGYAFDNKNKDSENLLKLLKEICKKKNNEPLKKKINIIEIPQESKIDEN